MKKVKVGSLNTLYESVANLDVNHFWTETSKEMLLQPRNSMEAYCQNLELNIDDTEKMKFFICQYSECSHRLYNTLFLSTFNDRICICGKPMNREIFPKNESMIDHKGFVQGIDSFIIFDNLKLMPDDTQNCVSLPMSFGYQDFNAIKEDTSVNVTRKEIVDLLKCSLVSETPLTDYFLRKKIVYENEPLRSSLLFNIVDKEYNDRDELIKLKVIVRKSKKKVLFAVAEADFVDNLLSFLTFPLGGVEYMMKGNSCLGSIDNLYQSVVDLDCDKYLNSPTLKDELVNTPLAQQFKHQNQILPIDEVPLSEYLRSTSSVASNVTGYLTDIISTFSSNCYIDLSYLHPRSSTYHTSSVGKGFVKSGSLYMVSDDLIVTPTSSMSLVSYLAKCNIYPSDLEERVISIGKKECLSLLKASLVSSSALTDGLGQFLYPIEEEKISN